MSAALMQPVPSVEVPRVVALPPGLPDGIDLWLVDLDRYAATVPITGLQDHELARGHVFRFERDQRRFLAGRHALREILGAALGRPAPELRIVTDRHGKPLLNHGAESLHFNLSHSGHLALIALREDGPIGVDIEILEFVPDIDALAAQHFTLAERQVLDEAATATRDRVFLQGWTRKEACLKALGIGLMVDARNVEAGCATTTRRVCTRFESRNVETRVWTVDVASIPDTIAAVAIAPEGWESIDDHPARIA